MQFWLPVVVLYLKITSNVLSFSNIVMIFHPQTKTNISNIPCIRIVIFMESSKIVVTARVISIISIFGMAFHSHILTSVSCVELKATPCSFWYSHKICILSKCFTCNLKTKAKCFLCNSKTKVLYFLNTCGMQHA